MILRVDSGRVRRRASDRQETRYFVDQPLGRRGEPEAADATVRGHWCVENGLHFIKDRWWDEDRQWSTRPGLAERLATLRDAALTALRLIPGRTRRPPHPRPSRSPGPETPQGAEVHRSLEIGTLQSSWVHSAAG